MVRFVTAAAIPALIAGYASAQTTDLPDNLERLSRAESIGTTDFTTIEQEGEFADSIRQTLEEITLPEGFSIELYALVPDARSMAVGPQGIALFVGTRKEEIWVVTDRDKNRVGDEVKNFAPSLAKSIPNGLCFSPDGFLYSVEQNRVVVYPAAEFFYESPDVVAGAVVAQGELIPEEEESFNHSARVCDIGPDGMLYIALGQPHNVPPPDKADLYNELGIGGMIRMNQDGTGREVFTRGIRNSVGMDFHPETGEVWFTDNQVDGMGDDIPPGEINRQTAAGQHFGFPWYGGGDIRTVEYQDSEPPADAVFPVVETIAHAADLGMHFYKGDMFPDQYRNAIFSAQHGSWNRTEPVGALVLVTTFDGEGTPTSQPFAEGWLTEDGEYFGRPMDVAELPDGSLLVSDDLAGAIYRISYEEPAQQ